MERLISEASYLLPPLVTFVVILILFSIVLRGTRRSLTKWLFCILLLSLGLWGLLLFSMRASPDIYHALPWDRAVAVTFYFSFVLYYHFTLAYTKNSGQRRILYVAYLLQIFFIALAPTNLIIERMRVASYGYAPVIGPLAIPLSLGSIFLMIGGGYNLIRRYIVSPSQEERTRLAYLVIATVFPLTGALLDALSDLPPMGIWGVLVFCFLSTVSIIKYHLLDIRIVVRKGLAFLLVSAVIAIPYVGLIFIVSGIFRQTAVLWWAQIIIVLLLAIVLRPLYSRAQQFIDIAFYRDRYNYLRALEQFSRETQSVANLEKLASTVVELVKGALRVLSVYLLVFSEHRYGFVEMSSTSSNNLPSGVVLRGNSPLARWLEHNKEILSSDQLDILPQLQSFSLRERNYLQLMGAALYVPIVTREGRLSGILALGKKLSEQSYSEEDKQVLSAVSNQMAMALENARLYSESQREVAEREQAEEALLESEERYRALLELSDRVGEAIILLQDTEEGEGIQIFFNAEWPRMTGYSKEELLGMPILNLNHPRYREAGRERYRRRMQGESIPELFEISMIRKDGTEIPVEFTAAHTTYRGKRAVVVYIRDITERKEIEQQLRQSQVLASLGQMTAGIAHEVNNPLSSIMLYSELLMAGDIPKHTGKDLRIIHNEAKRASRIMTDLLTYGRKVEPKVHRVDLHRILKKVSSMRQYREKVQNIKLINNLLEGPLYVNGDHNQLMQVFMNLVLNAEEALSKSSGGHITVTTKIDRKRAKVSIADNGTGIPEENLSQIF
ncbi:MAG: PAS domain S-box protein, partial [bacterium]